MKTVARYAQLGEQERNRDRLREIAAEKQAEVAVRSRSRPRKAQGRSRAEKEAKLAQHEATRAALLAQAAEAAKDIKPAATDPSRSCPSLDVTQAAETKWPGRREELTEILCARLRAGETLAQELGKQFGITKGDHGPSRGARDRVKRTRSGGQAQTNGATNPQRNPHDHDRCRI
jgi:hypothetical protein